MAKKIVRKKGTVSTASQDTTKSQTQSSKRRVVSRAKAVSTGESDQLESTMGMKETSVKSTHKGNVQGKKETVSHVSTKTSKHDPSKIPTSIIMSGVESDRYWDIVVKKSEIKTVLMSYHYLRKKPRDFLRKRLEETPDVRVFIDSGAFTFISKSDKYANMPDKFWKDYLDEYTGWIQENADCIFACADLDIDDIVGVDQIDQWREEYFEPLRKEHGVDVCYIWHELRGNEGWRKMCEKYDYVGLSTENDTLTLQSITKMINVAKKYNTRVHGMAVTKTDLLVRVPLFSCDSTTWIVGQQYGELNWFDGRSMKRLDKQTWRTTYKTRLLRTPFNADWDLLINGMGGRGDTYELLRLNVIAYKLAEEHIRKRLRTKMYWLVENTGAVEEEFKKSIEDVNIPSLEWFEEGEQEDYKFYLHELHLPADIPQEEAVDLLYSYYLYIRDDGTKLEAVETQDLLDYCKNIIDVEAHDRDSAIEAIRARYIDNALGLRRDFVSDEEEELMNKPKERKDYLKEDEFITINISPEELSGFLPAPKDTSMPEVDAYDEELKKMDIIPVRDDKGRFIAGQKKVRKPKQMYSDLMPKLACDTCYKAGDCEQYKAGFVCAFHKVFKKFDTRDMGDVMDAMYELANVNMGRTQRAIMFETMDGGMATPEVSMLIDQNMRLLKQVSELGQAKTMLQQKRVVREDGTEETVTSMNVNPSHGGILSQIFGSPTAGHCDIEEDDLPKPKKEASKDTAEIVDADYKVAED